MYKYIIFIISYKKIFFVGFMKISIIFIKNKYYNNDLIQIYYINNYRPKHNL